jgi:histidinol dehydrogenase
MTKLLEPLSDGTPAFAAELAKLAERGEADFARVEPVVREILAAVRAEGDAALRRYNERFGAALSGGSGAKPPAKTPGAPLLLRDPGARGAAALARLAPEARYALELAAKRIRAFHEREIDVGFRYSDAAATLGVRVLPVARAGVYAPGGKARYPSSVLMSAIPAQVAGVEEILLATPLAGDASDDPIFAAAHLAGVTGVVDAGGAQAIAALAYGTESVPRVDKIVGPGNLYVACAKRLVFGAVSIDGIAGPSEILVLADEAAEARVVAADLLSQAEHDEAAYPLLVCRSEAFARAVASEVEAQLASLPRAAIARASVEGNGRALVVTSRERMGEVADVIAAEHLALHVEDPEEMLSRVRRAGAAFVGSATPEAAGDYLAGPSHVLPTGGCVRFGSPLGVYDFVTRTSIIEYTRDTLEEQARAITAFARLEGLEGHARAVEVRIGGSRRRD